MLRGSIFKPRTNPGDFQGLGEKGIGYLREAKEKTNLPVVTEVMGSDEIELIAEVADVLQIGSRNMQNYDLLKKIGQKAPNVPVLLKRGMASTKEEVVGAIEYLRKYGHDEQIIICERGIRTSVSGEYDRNTLDIDFVADLKSENFPYPVIVDPSHSGGRKELVAKLCFAGIGAGADGFLIEVKEKGSKALCDDKQAVIPEELAEIINKTNKIYELLN